MMSIEEQRCELDNLRAECDKLLHKPEIQAGIGEAKSRRLIALSQEAGYILVSGHERLALLPQNGLYIMASHDNHGIQTGVQVEASQEGYSLDITRLLSARRAGHAVFRNESLLHFIVLPLAMFTHNHAEGDRTAVYIHELTHADQFNRANGNITFDARSQTRREAEAYAHQFLVVNHYLDGALTSIVEADVDDWLKIWATLSDVGRTAVGAVADNRTYGYMPDGMGEPCQSLVDTYQAKGLIQAA